MSSGYTLMVHKKGAHAVIEAVSRLWEWHRKKNYFEHWSRPSSILHGGSTGVSLVKRQILWRKAGPSTTVNDGTDASTSLDIFLK